MQQCFIQLAYIDPSIPLCKRNTTPIVQDMSANVVTNWCCSCKISRRLASVSWVLCMFVEMHNRLHTIELSNQAGLQSVLASGYIALCDCGAQVHPVRGRKKEKKKENECTRAIILYLSEINKIFFFLIFCKCVCHY